MAEIEVVKLVEDIKKIGVSVEEFRGRIEKNETEFKGVGELREAIDKMAKDLSDNFATVQMIEDLAKRNDELQGMIDRGTENQERAGVEPSEHRQAVLDILCKGCIEKDFTERTHDFLGSVKYRTLQEAVGPSGGFLVDPQTEAGIIKKHVDIDPVASVANIITLTRSNEVKKFREKTTPSATWEGELGSGTASEQTFEEIRIPVHALVAKTPLSEDLMEDVPYIEAEATTAAARQFSYSEGAAFISGNAVKKPRGIVTNVDVDNDLYPASVTGNGTNIIDGDDFSDMLTAAKTPYHANWTWMFNRNSLAKILQLKATTGNYLWQPGLQLGIPTMILAHPFILCETIANEGADTYPVYGGDFKMCYDVVYRSGIKVQRDTITTWPSVIVMWRKRVGAQIVLPEGVKILKTT